MNQSENLLLEKYLSSFDVARLYSLSALARVFEFDYRLSKRYLIPFRPAEGRVLEDTLVYEAKKNAAKRNTMMVMIRTWKCREDLKSIAEICGKYVDKNTTFLDLSATELSRTTVEEYYRRMLRAEEFERLGDTENAQAYKTSAENVFIEWAQSAICGLMVYYDSFHKCGFRTENYEEIRSLLKEHCLRYYPDYPEQLNVPDELLSRYNLTPWGLYGATHREDVFETEPEAERLPSALFAPIWTEDGQCRSGDETGYTARLKRDLDGYVEEQLRKNGRVGFAEIFSFLREEPYGFTQNRLSVYLMGALMRSYLFGDYYWTDDVHFEKLDAEHLDNALCKQVKNAYTSVPSLKSDYIVRLDPDTDELLADIEDIFGIKKHSPAVSELRHELRYALEGLVYPLWTLLYLNAGAEIEKIVRLCLSLANPDDHNAAAEAELFAEAGELLKGNPALRSEMKEQFTAARLTEGMNCFLRKAYGENSGIDSETLDAYMRKSLITSEWKWIWKEETVSEILKKSKE